MTEFLLPPDPPLYGFAAPALGFADGRGKRLGRKPASAKTEDNIRALRGKGMGKLKIVRELGIGTSVVQRVLAAA